MKHLVKLSAVAFLCAARLAFSQGNPISGGPAKLILSGPSAPVPVGTAFTVDASVELQGLTGVCAGAPRPVVLSGYDVSFSFDPAVVRFVSATRCPGAPDQFSSIPSFTSAATANQRGYTSVTTVQLDDSGPTGNFCIFRLNFSAAAGGASRIGPLLGVPSINLASAYCPDRTQPVAIPTTSNQITVTVPGGSPVRVVPIVLDVVGRGGARFSSELTLANRGTAATNVELSYTAADALAASGTGKVTEQLAAGEQKIVPDALAYLRSKGLTIPDSASGAQGGTLRATFADAAAETVFAGARTTSPAPSGPGRAGLSYPGPRVEEAATSKVALYGLRESASDRTNLALVNAGTGGSITLKVTLHSRVANEYKTFDLDPVTLGPGQWRQLNTVLLTAGFSDGYATVERTSGSEPFLCYAIFNDNVTNDGSYVPPVAATRAPDSQVVPVLVETATFQTELVLANPTDNDVNVTLEYIESLASPGGTTGSIAEPLKPREQRIIPNAIDYLRGKGARIGAKGAASYAGALRVSFALPNFLATPTDGFAGGRTGSPASGGGQYALFYPGVLSSAAATEAVVYGLQQNASSRSNLAFVNPGVTPVTLQYEIFDGVTRQRAGGPEVVTLGPGGWTQVNRVLDLRPGTTNAFIRVTRVSSSGSFVAYGVVNDGFDSTNGTNDGSYVEMSVVK